MTIDIFKTLVSDIGANNQYKANWKAWKDLNHASHNIFFPVFKEFLDYHLKNLSSGATRLYLFLGLKAQSTGDSWYSVKSMADYFEVRTRTIDNWLQELDDAGLIYRERTSTSSRTYLKPYSLNVFPIKPSKEKNLNDILKRGIKEAKTRVSMVGPIYQVFHFFQWVDETKGSCIQSIAVVAKRTCKDGPPQITGFVYADHFNTPESVIDTPHIVGVKSFISNIVVDGISIIGLAIEKDDKLTLVKNQRDALLQLSQAPPEFVTDLPEVLLIKNPFIQVIPTVT